MRTIHCARCGAQAARRGAYSFRGAEYCETCANELRSDPESSYEEFTALQDRTLCAFCGVDGGAVEYPLQMGLPACPSCEARLYHAPLPRWVQGFLVAVAAVLVVCSLLNLPYYRAFVGSKRAIAAMKRGDVALGSVQMDAASAALPANRDLASSAAILGAWASVGKGDDR